MSSQHAAVTQTRLDRLVTLLESGSTPSVRATAARQLGQLAAVRVRGNEISSNAARHAEKHLSNAAGVDDDIKVKQEAEDASPGISSGEHAGSSQTSASQPYVGVDGDWSQAILLIARVLPYLRSKAWDTRVAAAQAIQEICIAAGIWNPDYLSEQDIKLYSSSAAQSGNADESLHQESVGRMSGATMSFKSFSLPQVFTAGKKLLASAGNEFDAPTSASVEERLQNAKRDMQRLGLGSMAGIEMDLGVDVEKEIISDPNRNVSSSKTTLRTQPSDPQSPNPTLSPTPTTPLDDIDMSKLSARERNQLKRKRKLESKSGGISVDTSKTRVVESMLGSSPSSSGGVNLKTPSQFKDALTNGHADTNGQSAHASSTPTVDSAETLSDASSLVVPTREWPFSMLCALLLSDLFSPKWEIRHGAALALREILNIQGGSGGKIITLDGKDNHLRHASWSENVLLHLLCVLTLDRLGDFVFDHVVAPVRETVGQALASLLKWTDDVSVRKIHSLLVQMVRQDFLLSATQSGQLARRSIQGYAWEVRHAGLLGLRYEVSIRRDLLRGAHVGDEDILHSVTRIALACIQDDDDDVRGVAASTLLSIVEEIVEHVPEMVPGLLNQLWENLGSLKDDLSSSTGGIMDLLASLFSKPKVIEAFIQTHSEANAGESIINLIPRLYPIFRHTISSVRFSVVKALRSLLNAPSLSNAWIDDRPVRLVFQNLIVEERPQIRDASLSAWGELVASLSESASTKQNLTMHVNTFFEVLMTPLGTPLNQALFYWPDRSATSAQAYNVDKSILAQDLSLVGVDTVIRGRLSAAKALGAILSLSEAGAIDLLRYLESSSALQKCLASVVIQEWAAQEGAETVSESQTAQQAGQKLNDLLEAPAPATYAEMSVMLQRIQRQSQTLCTIFARDGKLKKERIPTIPIVIDASGQVQGAFTIESARQLAGNQYDKLVAQLSAKVPKLVRDDLEDRRSKLVAEVGFYQGIKEKQDVQVAASAAAAVVALNMLPAKLNPIIRSLMNSVKFEENAELQQRSAHATAELIVLCLRPDAKANPSEKVVKNLCAFVCQDTTQTPIFEETKGQREGISSVIGEQKQTDLPSRRQTGLDASHLTEEQRQGQNIRRGAEQALSQLAQLLGASIFDQLPGLWSSLASPLLDAFAAPDMDVDVVNNANGQAVVDACTLLQSLVPHLHVELHGKILSILPALTNAIRNQLSIIRSTASKSLATLACHLTDEVMIHIVEHVLPLLDKSVNLFERQGAIEVLSEVVRVLDVKLLPYVVVLILPILGRMSDTNADVRHAATGIFASLVKLVPLETSLPDPPNMPAHLTARRQDQRAFLESLLDGKKVEPYKMPVGVNAELRNYQIDGVSWMAFLARFQLHGVLCDDMGLGKTLQTICILASKHFERAHQAGAKNLPSLIVCPPTLTGHWHHEISQYSTNLKPLLYAGQPQERVRLQKQFTQHDCIIAAYDTVRNDIEALSKFDYLYCILDEGHMIKNARAKTAKAVKEIRAQHRLILSGTPIQNNVLELWSLFDFLMPGFLGTERQFMDRYGRAILASRDAKVTTREHERASLALEALHKQVLPFLLRRMKEDVLADLPPKIIQDISCDMSEVQKQLYNDFLREQNPDDFDDSVLQRSAGEGGVDGDSGKKHIFQTLQYLRKLVCHPSMVFDENRAKHKQIRDSLARSGKSMDDLVNAPKLLALQQLLLDCGIGGADSGAGFQDAANDDATISQHRVLIFCQQKQMLDIIERSLFQKHMKSVTYARLDGSISSPEKRYAIVQQFNTDPSIDVLLLTTSVGGLGLTLTGADTVIFVEHDWNPMKDLQAMDRAHRLGQKKVVNVYRLITKDTLEEKIMGLQQFKLNVAGNVVNQQNKAMDSMATDQILDLFDVGGQGSDEDADKKKGSSSKGLSQKALLASLEQEGDTGDDYADMQSWMA